MKTRRGFVSNSSSTSFVVLLPKGLDVEALDYSSVGSDGDHDHGTRADCIEAIRSLQDDGYYDTENEVEGVSVYRLKSVLKDFIIASVETGCDGTDRLATADQKKVEKILAASRPDDRGPVPV